MKPQAFKVICVAVILSNLCYYRIVVLLQGSLQKNTGAPLAFWTPICTGLAALALVLAVLLASRKIRLRTEAAEVVTALLLAESATALFGLLLVFLGLPQEKFLYFLGSTLVVQLVCVAPRVFGNGGSK